MANGLRERFERLCSPAQLYFTLAVLGVVVGIITRFAMPNKDRQHVVMSVYFVALVIILGWTWILNWLCKDGYSKLAWALVLFPYFLVLALSFCTFIAGVAPPDQIAASIYAAIIIIIGFSMMKK